MRPRRPLRMTKGHQKDLHFLALCKGSSLTELLQLLRSGELTEWKRVAVQRAIKRLLVMEEKSSARTSE